MASNQGATRGSQPPLACASSHTSHPRTEHDMRLLKLLPSGKWGVTSDLQKNELLLYAILSHTWDHDGQEVTFDELHDGRGTTKRGWQKLEFCIRQTNADGLRHVWCDSCCINKANPAEKHDAFNTMFSWYAKAHICYVYLADVLSLSDLAMSRWWTRGWTLQELLAPKDVVFFSRDGVCLGTKLSLLRLVHEITGISERALSGEQPLWSFDIEERLSWMKGRRTTFEEDYAYCLQGVLGIEIARRYGEGLKKAIERLKEEATLTSKSRPRKRRPPSQTHEEKLSSEFTLGSPARFEAPRPSFASKPVFGAPAASQPPPSPGALYGQPPLELLEESCWDDLELDLDTGGYAGDVEFEEEEVTRRSRVPWDGADVVVTLEDLGLSPNVNRILGPGLLDDQQTSIRRKDLRSRLRDAEDGRTRKAGSLASSPTTGRG